MPALAQQVAAWKASWRRLENANEDIKTCFLRKVGEHLGEGDAETAIRVGRHIVGSSCAANSATDSARRHPAKSVCRTHE